MPDRVLSFARECDGNTVIVVANLSPEPVNVGVDLGGREGEYTDFATGGKCTAGTNYELDKWTCKIMTR